MIFPLELEMFYIITGNFWPFNVSLAGRQLSHGVAAEYGTGGRLGWQSAILIMKDKEDRRCKVLKSKLL